MNIVLTALTVIALMGAVSCNKVEEMDGNSSTIRFGVSTIYENGPATKTEYSGKDQSNNSISSTSTAERIDWLSTDKIRILSPQATLLDGSDKYADYQVNVSGSGTDQTHSASIAPIGNGLQWGEGSHNFFALYPSPEQNSAAGICVDGEGATVTGTVPAAQTATLSGHVYKPDMDYAYMYAVKAGVSAGSSVSLDFKPLVTTLEFTLLTKAGDPITSKLTSVKLSSSQSTSYLTGAFTAELTTSGLTAVTKDDITGGGNEITIMLPDGGVQLSTNAAEAYTVTFLTLPLDQTELTLTLGFADSSKRTLKLKDNGSWITVDACKKTYIWKLDAPKTVGTETSISGGTAYKFGDAYLTNGILKKTDSTFSIEEDPFVLCTAYGGTDPSQGSSSGTRYYFNFIELGQYFSNNASFNENSGNIPAVQTVSYNGHNWRMPSQGEWAAATTTAGRTGSTVNGTSGARYALVLVDLTGSVHAGEGLTSSDGYSMESNSNYMAALLLFPDGATVTCDAISSSSINSNSYLDYSTSTVSYTDISTLVSGGCVVLPAAGIYTYRDWDDVGGGIYWSGSEDGTNDGYGLYFPNRDGYPEALNGKSDYFFPVVLARGTTEISVTSTGQDYTDYDGSNFSHNWE